MFCRNARTEHWMSNGFVLKTIILCQIGYCCWCARPNTHTCSERCVEGKRDIPAMSITVRMEGANCGELPDVRNDELTLPPSYGEWRECRTIIINNLLKIGWNRNFRIFFRLNEWLTVWMSADDSISGRNLKIMFVFLNIFLVFCADKSTPFNVSACVKCVENWQSRARRSRSLHSSLSMCPKHVNLVRCHFSYFIFILSNAVSITINFCSPHFRAEIPHFYRTNIRINCHLKFKICDQVFQRMNFVSISFPFFDFPVFFRFFLLLSSHRS